MARKRDAAKGNTPPRMPNIYDVAREAKVSVFTVSSVINSNGQVSAVSRRRVQAAIEKLNYRPNLLARSLAKRQTFTIGIVVPDISNPFFPQVVRGAEDVLQKAGYSALLCNSDDQEQKEEHYLDFLMSRRVDGILLAKTPARMSPAVRQRLLDSRIPIVLLMRSAGDFLADAVMTDDGGGAFEAVSHMASLGYKSIAFVSGPLEVSNATERRDGYLRALKAYRLTANPKLMYEGDYRMDSGYRAGLTLLPRRPEAVFIANYMMMIGFMKSAEEMGLHCPEDFGVVSFDDYPWLGFFRPRMTTVELPKYELGSAGAQLLLDRIAGNRQKPTLLMLPTQLRVRESCGFPQRTRRSRPHEAADGTRR
ncbi:MAG TPA: LacI family DNA-binding transcriptional regulator [Terriglobales bacterium]|nr:LacI family DNA-binding transcriptional regulator [Terriglobales bacterium]